MGRFYPRKLRRGVDLRILASFCDKIVAEGESFQLDWRLQRFGSGKGDRRIDCLHHPEALLMPLPSTRRSSLDSFLPQFAPPIDDLTQPGTTPHGDNGRVDVNDRRSGINGHGVSLDEDLRIAEPTEDSL